MGLPRTYPQGFAEKIRELHQELVGTGEGMPVVDPHESPQKAFETMTWSTWEEAKLVQVLRYLRGNRHLDAPASWISVFPKPFEILHKLEKQANAG